MTLNTRGLKNKTKRSALFSYLKQQKINVACLQETHVSEKDIKIWGNQWGGQIFFNSGTNRSKGEIILVAKNIENEAKLIKKENRMIVLEGSRGLDQEHG